MSSAEIEILNNSAKAQPDFLTVAQAAEVIGLGRTKTYQLARNAADNGVGPFPAVRFGKQPRIPRRKLEALSGGPIILQLDDDTAFTTSHDEPDPTNNTDHPPTTTRPVDTPTDLQQQPLPFTGIGPPMPTNTTTEPIHTQRTDECTVESGRAFGSLG